jgi:hypothetical protein
MDRLIQGIDDDSGRPYVLFGKVKVQTLPGGRWRVVDEGRGRLEEFDDRDAALAAAGLDPQSFEAATHPAPEAAIVRIHGLVSQLELRALDRVARELGLTREAAVRRAVAQFILEHDG